VSVFYIDCFSGAAGDMILGALIDVGLPIDALKSALGSLAIEYGDITAERVLRAGVTSTKFRLVEHAAGVPQAAGHAHSPSEPHPAAAPARAHAPAHAPADAHAHAPAPSHPHHHLKHIVAAIRRSSLSRGGQDRAVHLFERLAEAEAAIHNTPMERVHLHEVGALDSIIDIVGCVFGFEWFGIDDIVASPLNVGGGTVRCAHGVFPVPAPATARLLAGVPVYGNGTTELVTPTGALIVTSYAREFGPLPAMTIEKVGYGAGDRDPKDTPNVLRILRGERVEAAVREGAERATGPLASDRAGVWGGAPREDEQIVKLECEIDDMNPQLFGPLMDSLMAAGALDVFYTPVQMKKNRPGTLVTVLGRPDLREPLTDILFRGSTTIGVRYQQMSRACLERATESVETPFGSIRFKVARRNGEELNAAPEFDDCARLAVEHRVPIKTIQAAAVKAWLDRVR
jgi:pyridinium-3,5-bisthiocarboxylic acid mononucleotide nickel chelatase